jgi:hypothetical protein
VAADAHELVHERSAAEDRPVFHGDVACHLHGVRENDAIADLAIMRDMRVRHEQAVAADARRAAGFAREVRGHVLAHHRPIADHEVRRLAAVLEILRRAADHGAVVQPALPADGRPAGDERVAADGRAVADLHVRADHGPGPDLHADAELRAFVDERGGVNADRAHVAFRSTTIASSSASATSWSSTNASACILAVPFLSFSSVSRMRS